MGRIGIILAVSLLAAGGHAWIAPFRLSLDPSGAGHGALADGRVTLVEARRLYDEGETAFVDARHRREYDKGHIPAAHSLPPDAFNGGVIPEELTMFSREFTPIIVYCESEEACDASLMVARRLQDFGFTRVRILQVGFEGWRSAGLPVEPR